MALSVAALAPMSYAPTVTPRAGRVVMANPGLDVFSKIANDHHVKVAETGLAYDDQAVWTTNEISTQAGMMELAKKLNPTVGFWDPLGLVGADAKPETIGWFRHAEIKHGRVAMAAFVGYCVQSNGICFPWNIQGNFGYDLPTVSFADISAAGGPADQWDALPTAAKVQILCVIGFLEMWSETSAALEMDGQKHYVRGGKPGYFPKLKGKMPHPTLDLWDPFGFTAKMTEERKAKALLAEVNNGRLAMIGIFGMISASKGLKVPGLDSIAGIKPYAGEVMAPFTAVRRLVQTEDARTHGAAARPRSET